VRHDYALIPCWVDSVTQPDPLLAGRIKGYQEQIDADYGRTIGQLTTDWQRNSQGESNIGNYIADVMRRTAAADFAVINSGGIRKDMPAGPIKKLDIVEILPFTNTLVTFTCTGEELMKIVQSNVRSAAREEPGVLQVSGLKYQYRVTPGGTIEITGAMINGNAIDPQATYTGATIDFILFGQAERFFGFAPTGKTENTNQILSDVVVTHIETQPAVASSIEGRMVRIP